MYENKSDFGRCPECGAIVSLDSKCNVLCDRCRTSTTQRIIGRSLKGVIMPTKEDLDNGFNPFDF